MNKRLFWYCPRLAGSRSKSDNSAVDQTGELIALGVLAVVAVVVAIAIGWWRRQRKRVEETEAWPQAEAAVESGRL